MRCSISKAKEICDILEPAVSDLIGYFDNKKELDGEMVRNRSYHATALTLQLYSMFLKDLGKSKTYNEFEKFLATKYAMFVSKDYWENDSEQNSPEVRLYIGNGEPGSFITASYIKKYFELEHEPKILERDMEALKIIADRVATFIQNGGYERLSDLFEKYLGLIEKSEDWYDEENTDFAFKALRKNSIFDLFGQDLSEQLNRLF